MFKKTSSRSVFRHWFSYCSRDALAVCRTEEIFPGIAPISSRVCPKSTYARLCRTPFAANRQIDPLTVGHQTGTSLAMIEKAYLRFIPQAFRERLSSMKEAD